MKTYNGFDLSQEDKSNLNAITTAFDRCAIGETNEILERYLFNKTRTTRRGIHRPVRREAEDRGWDQRLWST